MEQAVELVHRSTTRRKACAGCVKAKRRCDLTIPSCSRCTARHLTCGYNDTAAAQKVSGVPVKGSLGKTILPLPVSTAATIDVEMTQESFLSSPYNSFQLPVLTTLDAHQIEYCVFELRQCIVSVALEGRTPFIHPDLYQDTMPETYQDLLSICSLYNQKTNSEIVFRMLFIKLLKLISASRSMIRAEDWLLAVQTLTIYQVIRIFDGDSKQKANAEQDFDLLRNWTAKLQEVEAEEWLLKESIRRTIMVSHLLQCLCKVMKDGVSDLALPIRVLPVSENVGEWEGKSQEGRPLVTYQRFVDDWNEGAVMVSHPYEMLLLKACRHAIIPNSAAF